jgi:hypothetical protein
MAKKSFLSGVDAETRKEIYKLRKDARDNAKVEASKAGEQYREKLLDIQKSFNDALDEAKKDNLIPKSTTIAKIGMLPKKEPKRWATTYNRIFGRKKAKAKAKAKSIVSRISSAVSSPKPKPKAKAKPPKKAPAKKK